MLTKFLDLIPNWLLVGLIAAALALAGLQTVRLSSARDELVDAAHDLSKAKDDLADARQAIAVANTEAANKATALQTQVTKAQNEARKRETDLRAAADDARSESDGLRDDLARLRDELAEAAGNATAERAAALGVVLHKCAAEYQGLAQRCDRHVNDLRTLMEAWPR